MSPSLTPLPKGMCSENMHELSCDDGVAWTCWRKDEDSQACILGHAQSYWSWGVRNIMTIVPHPDLKSHWLSGITERNNHIFADWAKDLAKTCNFHIRIWVPSLCTVRISKHKINPGWGTEHPTRYLIIDDEFLQRSLQPHVEVSQFKTWCFLVSIF